MSERFNKKFKINEEKRTITCIITVEMDILEILRKYGFETGYLIDNDYETIYKTRTYVGIAKCAKEDKWNEDFGKRLAEYRAMRKRQIDVNNEIKDFYKKEIHKLNNLSNYGLLKTPKDPRENAEAANA